MSASHVSTGVDMPVQPGGRRETLRSHPLTWVEHRVCPGRRWAALYPIVRSRLVRHARRIGAGLATLWPTRKGAPAGSLLHKLVHVRRVFRTSDAWRRGLSPQQTGSRRCVTYTVARI
jgi:hypothetical protein